MEKNPNEAFERGKEADFYPSVQMRKAGKSKEYFDTFEEMGNNHVSFTGPPSSGKSVWMAEMGNVSEQDLDETSSSQQIEGRSVASKQWCAPNLSSAKNTRRRQTQSYVEHTAPKIKITSPPPQNLIC